MNFTRFKTGALCAFFILTSTLLGCGGGGGGSSTPGSATALAPLAPMAPVDLVLTGTATTGLAIANATVNAKCLVGNGSTKSLADGSYRLLVSPGQLPCLLEVISPKDGLRLHSIALGTSGSASSASANLTPLSELLVARMAHKDPATAFNTFDAASLNGMTAAAVQAAQADVAALLSDVVDTRGLGNFLSIPLKAATPGDLKGGDAQDKVLDALGLSLNNAHLAQVAAAFARPGNVYELKQLVANLAAPSSTNSSIVSGPVPEASYPAGSEELAAFSYLNAQRLQCGFGLLKQSEALDKAAKAHADWQIINNYSGHYEELNFSSGSKLGQPTVGFTGNSPSDRVIAAGYATAATLRRVDDDLSAEMGGYVWAGFGVRSIKRLLNAPYHLRSLVSPNREVGLASRSDAHNATTSTYGRYAITQLNLGIKEPETAQLMASSEVHTYPCDGSTGVDRQLTNESPSPVPGRDLAKYPLGTSIYISLRLGQTLVISNVNMIDASSGVTVPLRTPVTAANDPNPGHLTTTNDAFISADSSLAANTRYQVTINGSNSGTAFSRTFMFTTGG